jgi:hypothetical protein
MTETFPPEVAAVRQQFENWRATQTQKGPLPDDVLKSQTGQAREFGELLKLQLKDGVALYKEFHQPAPLADYAARVQALEEALDWHLRPRPLKDADNQRLLNEIGRHHDRGNVLRFLHEPETVAPTNNAAAARLTSGSDCAQSISMFKEQKRRGGLRGVQKRHRHLEKERRQRAGKTHGVACWNTTPTTCFGEYLLTTKRRVLSRLSY